MYERTAFCGVKNFHLRVEIAGNRSWQKVMMIFDVNLAVSPLFEF